MSVRPLACRRARHSVRRPGQRFVADRRDRRAERVRAPPGDPPRARRPVALLCALADAVLIGAGVLGIGTLVERAPVVLDVVRWGGVAFLLGYAVLALRRAVRPEALVPGETGAGTSLKAGAHDGGRPDVPQSARLPRHRPAARLDRQPARRRRSLGVRARRRCWRASRGSSDWRTAPAGSRPCSRGRWRGGCSTG